MLQIRDAFLAVLGAAVFATSSVGAAQPFPSKPVRIVTSPPGGGNDFVARLIANKLAVFLGAPMVIENRPSLLSAEIVAQATPDGYTTLLAGSTALFAPLVQPARFDPLKDFAAISMVSSSPAVLVVNPQFPAKSVKDLIAITRAQPGKFNYASSGSGGVLHLGAELFKKMTGVNIVRVSYKGSGPADRSVMAGETQLEFGTAPSVAPHIKSGALRALAVTSAQASALFPGLPTVASTVPGFEVTEFKSFWAPKGTPRRVVTRLNRELMRVLKLPEVVHSLEAAGSESTPGSPDQLSQFVTAEITKWRGVIKDAGINAR